MTSDRFAFPVPTGIEVPQPGADIDWPIGLPDEVYLELVLRDGHFANYAQVFGALLVHGSMTTGQVAETAQIHPVTTRSALQDLREKGNVLGIERKLTSGQYSVPPRRQHTHYPIDLAASRADLAKTFMLRYAENTLRRESTDVIRHVLRQVLLATQ